jgi:hypoxanthine phosphoribosyltransferase
MSESEEKDAKIHTKRQYVFADIRERKIRNDFLTETEELPQRYLTDLGGILLDEQEIRNGVVYSAARINQDLGPSAETNGIVLVTVLQGAMIFSSDLMRKLNFPFETDTIAVSSYDGTRSTGAFRVKKDLSHPVFGKDVLIIEDIVDTGKTLDYLISHIEAKKPASVSSVTLLDKVERRADGFGHIKATYTCFEIPDAFVLGYGLDYRGHFRGIPVVAVKKTLDP